MAFLAVGFRLVVSQSMDSLVFFLFLFLRLVITSLHWRVLFILVVIMDGWTGLYIISRFSSPVVGDVSIQVSFYTVPREHRENRSVGSRQMRRWRPMAQFVGETDRDVVRINNSNNQRRITA